MYDDPYYGTAFEISEHPFLDEEYNGLYVAVDSLYNSDRLWTYFMNSNGMYLYYDSYSGEGYGFWLLNNNEY